MDKLIEQLEIYILKNKISQEELAKKLGVAFSTVNRWFNRRTIPNKTQQFHILQLIYPEKDLTELYQEIRSNR